MCISICTHYRAHREPLVGPHTHRRRGAPETPSRATPMMLAPRISARHAIRPNRIDRVKSHRLERLSHFQRTMTDKRLFSRLSLDPFCKTRRREKIDDQRENALDSSRNNVDGKNDTRIEYDRNASRFVGKETRHV